MRCKRWQSDIIQLVEGTLEKEQQRKVNKHLEKCIRCQQSFEQLQTSHQMFLDYTPPEFKATLDVWPKLQAKIFKTSERRQILSKWLKEAWLAPSVRIVVCVCLIFAVLGAALMGYKTFQKRNSEFGIRNSECRNLNSGKRAEVFILPDAGLLSKQSETFLIENALIISDKPEYLTF